VFAAGRGGSLTTGKSPPNLVDGSVGVDGAVIEEGDKAGVARDGLLAVEDEELD
jgi:hypothetical protein